MRFQLRKRIILRRAICISRKDPYSIFFPHLLSQSQNSYQMHFTGTHIFEKNFQILPIYLLGCFKWFSQLGTLMVFCEPVSLCLRGLGCSERDFLDPHVHACSDACCPLVFDFRSPSCVSQPAVIPMGDLGQMTLESFHKFMKTKTFCSKFLQPLYCG